MLQSPDWLKRRGGDMVLGTDQKTWFLEMNNQPLYRLVPVPVQGKFGCAITQTNNGKRIPSETLAENKEGALQGGLQDLAKYLGWVE